MKMTNWSLLGVGLIVAVFAVWPASAPAASQARVPEAPPDTPAAPSSVHGVRVYYFHGNARCVSCRKIESLAGEAVRAAFSAEMKQGKVEWLVVNVEDPSNKHFIQDYKLYTKSVVVVDLLNGVQVRWKNLERVWELLLREDLFRQYVQGEVKSYLEKPS